MAKFNHYKLEPKEKRRLLDEFYTMVSYLKDKKEVENFFKDLLSEGEAIMLARRIQVAKKLLEGLTFEEIKKQLKVGFDTITSVQHWLMEGFGGYLKTLQKDFTEQIKNEKERVRGINKTSDSFSFEALKKKYPLHFLLFNIFDEIKIEEGVKNERSLVKKAKEILKKIKK